MSNVVGNMVRSIRRSGVKIPALLLAAWFFAFSLALFLPKTPDGVQCVTAPVQSVMKTVRDKCGCIVAVRAEKPKPGDKAFVQCRCAEKKAADQVSSTSSPKFEMMAAEAPSIELPGRLILPRQSFAVKHDESSMDIAPDTLPPSLA